MCWKNNSCRWHLLAFEMRLLETERLWNVVDSVKRASRGLSNHTYSHNSKKSVAWISQISQFFDFESEFRAAERS